MPTSPYIVLLNAHAGAWPPEQARAFAEDIKSAFAQAGAEADVRLVEGERLADETQRAAAQSPPAVVAAGGDGTQSAVAGALAGGQVPMGVLPLGTLNHFAKDLGMPQELEDAVAAIVHGTGRAVDVASVNGRVFVNNSSIGLYPQVVKHRDDMQERLGHGKWYAMLLAVLAIFRRFPLVHLRVGVNGQTFERNTPFLFIGNNQYPVDVLTLGQRVRMDEGVLCLYFTNRTGRTAMLRLALKALVGRLRQDRDFNALCAAEVWIESNRKSLSVALDGEVVRMTPPLHYQVRPGALRVKM